MYCEVAPLGQYVSDTGAQAPTLCAPNTYADNQQSRSCLPCPTGYTSAAGAITCIATVSNGGG